MENFESQQFRDELAKEIKEVPKEERKEILEKAKETPEYWQARTEKIKERQDEEEIDNGFGVLVEKKTLYHGSGISGIKEQGKFTKAEEDTVGSGIYFTSEAKDAIGYARLRAERERMVAKRENKENKDFSPTIYESSIENMKLLDLRKDENIKKVLEGFKAVLKEELKRTDVPWFYRGAIENSIEIINNGNMRGLKNVTQNNGELFSKYVKSLGYEGLIALEGGEGNNDNHDTYLIFDSDKVKINQEHKIL